MSIHNWQTELYDIKLNYVSKFGKDVVALLNPMNEETVLDIGCGTGELAYEISKTGSKVIGMDKSTQMIEAAKKKYAKSCSTMGLGL